MKVHVDLPACVGSGQCVLAAPEVFDQDDEGIAVLLRLAGHDETAIMAGELDPTAEKPRVLVAYRRGDLLSGVLSIGMPPRQLRQWRSLIAARTHWRQAAGAAVG